MENDGSRASKPSSLDDDLLDDSWSRFSRQQCETDQSQLRTLSLIYYLLAALNALSGVFVFLGTLAGGLLMIVAAGANSKDPPLWVGLLILSAGLLGSGLIGLVAYLLYRVGLALKEQNRRTLCLVIAGLLCLSPPLGTIVGVCTIVVLQRDSVRELFLYNDTVLQEEDS